MKLRLILLLTLACGLSAASQVTSRSAFTTAPLAVFPTIPQTTRLDMIDYFEGGSSKTMPNSLDGQVSIEAMTDDVMRVSTGSLSATTIVVLPASGKEIIMVIDQLATPALDSYMKFYNSRWEELNRRSLLPEPTLTDWVGKLPSDQLADIENAMPFVTASATYSPETRTLTLTPTLSKLLTDDDMKIVRPVLKPSLQYRWNGKKFVKQ